MRPALTRKKKATRPTRDHRQMPASGKAPAGHANDHNRALTILLTRLASFDAVPADAVDW